MIEIPYEWIKSIFGTYIADNFNTICCVICLVGLLSTIIRGMNRPRHYHDKVTRNKHSDDQPEYKSKTGKWTPSGWVFNEKKQLWEPPDYLSKQSKQKWRWDDEKKIWIDIEKEKRLARYKEYHKDKPPTYEEWKKENHPEN